MHQPQPIRVGFSKSVIFSARFMIESSMFHAPASPHSGWYMVARYVNEGLSRIHMPGFRMQQLQTTHAVGVQLGLGEQPFS